MFGILPWWTCPIAMIVVSVASGAACWHQKGKIDEAELSSYKAKVSLAQAEFEKKYTQLKDNQTQVTIASEKQYENHLSSVTSYYSNLLRQRSTDSSGKVPPIPEAPGSIDEIPTNALPLAGQCAETTQQLVDLQDWITKEESVE